MYIAYNLFGMVSWSVLLTGALTAGDSSLLTIGLGVVAMFNLTDLVLGVLSDLTEEME